MIVEDDLYGMEGMSVSYVLDARLELKWGFRGRER